MNTKKNDVLALLMMPPPIHGASVINQRMVKALTEGGCNVHVLNTVPSDISRLFGTRFWVFARAWVVVKVIFNVILRIFNRPTVAYIGISGGYGIVFDCAIALALRSLRIPVVVHHHSFAYINKDNLLFSLFCYLLKSRDVTHVVLCVEMGEQLCGRYKNLVFDYQIHVLSNAAFFEDDAQESNSFISKDKLRIGYISNITKEKGIGDVISLFEACKEAKLPIEMIVAGPCADSVYKSKLNFLSDNYCDFSYLGPVYGEIKHKFYESIDILAFPTRYENEAEPLIIYEAAEQGVPTIANARGCIASMVEKCGGKVVRDEESFVDEAVKFCSKLFASDLKINLQRSALLGSEQLRGVSKSSLNDLVKKIGTYR